MDAQLAEQITRYTCEWLDEMMYEFIRVCVNGPVPGGINLLVMADVFGMKADSLREVQEWLERKMA
jgi:hypothetical protein